ncbi:MAG: helix-turn-helix domain-containing protein [Chloroflexi bacterium]|nr:helix-turn-helix domain-containing protein [Chloroflexota bacterium]
MNDVQQRLAVLQEKGWTLAAIADELGLTPNAVQKWKSGDRQRVSKATLEALNRLQRRQRIPKQRRYAKGSDHATP